MDRSPSNRDFGALALYFGLRPDQALSAFHAEVRALSDSDLAELAGCAADQLTMNSNRCIHDAGMAFLYRTIAPGRAHCPVRLQGRPGTGKSYLIREFGRLAGFDHYIEIAGHRGLEAFDLFGQHLLVGGDTVWKDGAVTEAFRLVGCADPTEVALCDRAGVTALLNIDEVARIPAREREAFLTMLSPVEIEGIPCYRLRAGRPLPFKDGALRDEILYAPCRLLSIAASTNVGAEFDIEEDCQAGRERWVSHYVRFDPNRFAEVVLSHLNARRFAPSWSKAFLKLQRTLEKAVEDNHLRGTLSLRTATRIICLSPSERRLGQTCFEVLEFLVAPAANGEPIAEQIEVLCAAIEAAGFDKPETATCRSRG